MAAVEVEELVVRYGPVTAVDGLSFAAEAGQVTVVLGPNGAGKTSTIEALEGYRRLDAGRVSVVGLDPVAHHAALTRRIGVMLQEGGVHPGIRALEALRHTAALHADAVDPAALLGRVGLAGRERRTWRQLSGGEQRRLALALALVGRPQVAFLDEPTAGVDPQGRASVRSIIAGLRDDGVTVVLTTHDLDEAQRLADRVVIIDRGRLVAQGSPAELMRGGAGQEIRFGAAPGLDLDGPDGLAARLGAQVTEATPGEYVAATPATPAAVAALAAWLAERDLPLADLRAGRQRLEDVFLRLVADAEVTGTQDASEPGGGTAGSSRGRRRGRRRGRG